MSLGDSNMNGLQTYAWHGVHNGDHVVMHGHMRAGLSKEQVRNRKKGEGGGVLL